MTIMLNGKSTDVAANATVADVVRTIVDADASGVAVAVNENVVPKRDWPRHRLAAGDAIEIIHAVQGG